jgi:hypothetical protein
MKQFELFQVSKFTENLENNFSEKKSLYWSKLPDELTENV